MASIRHSSVQGLITVQTAAYNDNGTRLATCSADGMIHVSDRCEDQEHWQLTSQLPTESSLKMVKVPPREFHCPAIALAQYKLCVAISTATLFASPMP